MASYIFPMQKASIHSDNFYTRGEQLNISYQASVSYRFQTDDTIFVYSPEEESLLPYEFQVVSVNQNAHWLVLKVETIYANALPRTAINLLLGTYGDGLDAYNKLTKDEIDAIISLMKISQGDRPQLVLDNVSEYAVQQSVDDNLPTTEIHPEDEIIEDTVYEEQEVLEHIQNYILKRGYYFEPEVLYNYHICLKTRPFVILAGLSGTGKSKLAQLYADALGHTKHYLRLAVRPNWDDDRYLLGHFNTITGKYVTEPALDFVLNANKQANHLFFFCLDEMNLAHVEYYFSQFLSALEEDRVEDRLIPLLSESVQHDLIDTQTLPAQLRLPENLLFTGTINMDETTQSISDKVIDRANTLEFFQVDLDKLPDKPESNDAPTPLFVSASNWQLYQAQKPDKRFRAQIVEMNAILNTVGMGIGFRVLYEIELYIANSTEILEPLVALDLQIKQRILPRIRGTELIGKALDDLLKFSKKYKLSRTEQRLNEMKSRLKDNGYTSFWR